MLIAKTSSSTSREELLSLQTGSLMSVTQQYLSKGVSHYTGHTIPSKAVPTKHISFIGRENVIF